MKKALLYSNGCLENILEINQYRNILEQNDWQITDTVSGADLILVNTCTVPKEKEDVVVRKINYFQKKKNQTAKIIITGTLPQMNPLRLKTFFKGDTFAPHDLNKFKHIIGATTDDPSFSNNYIDQNYLGDLKYPRKIKKALSFCKSHHIPIPNFLFHRFQEIEDETMFYIKITTGCIGNCSYCGIKKVKGAVKSKPLQQIVEEFEEGLRLGYTRFVLIGEDLGAYGIDIDTPMPRLLKKLCQFEGDYKIIIRFIEPSHFIKYFSDFLDIFKSNKIASICTPIQSGNNLILKAMNRRYKIEDIVSCLIQTQTLFPNIMLRTHFIVGFPGETKENFKDTLTVLDQIDFDVIVPAIFYAYPNTKSAKMANQYPYSKKFKRFCRLAIKIFYNVYLNKFKILS